MRTRVWDLSCFSHELPCKHTTPSPHPHHAPHPVLCNSHKNEHRVTVQGSGPWPDGARLPPRMRRGQEGWRQGKAGAQGPHDAQVNSHHWELQNQIPRIPGPIPSSSLQENKFAIIGSAKTERWAWDSFATRGCPSKHKKPIAPYTRHVHLTHKR